MYGGRGLHRQMVRDNVRVRLSSSSSSSSCSRYFGRRARIGLLEGQGILIHDQEPSDGATELDGTTNTTGVLNKREVAEKEF